jgi:hypothetical protein
MNRTTTLAGLIAVAFSASGCGLGCRDVNRIHAGTAAGFTVTDLALADSTPAALYAGLDYTQSGVQDFPRVFAVIANETHDSRNLLMTVHGYETTPGDRLDLALSIPANARTGDQFRVAGTFVPPAYPGDEWGFRAPLSASDVEVGFTRSHAAIPNPPYDYTAHYTATSATGTIRVAARDRGLLHLALDVTVSDASGHRHRIAGVLMVTSMTQGQACPGLD